MSDLVLTTRLAMLRSNLEQVAGILQDAERRSAEILQVRDRLTGQGGIEGSVKAIRQRLKFGLAHLDMRRVEDIDSAIKEIEAALEQIETTISRIGECKIDLQDFLERRVKIGGKGVERLIARAEGKRREVESIEEALEGANGDTPEVLRTAWRDYQQRLQGHSDLLFGEYVDVLRGLALRETGLDEGICRIAEMLLEICGHVGLVHWDSLTIPARRAAMAMTVAQLIRLGFPEWTLWALPLAAYELAHVVVSEHTELDSYRQRQTEVEGVDGRHLDNCLADAFASYTMGPAYACAALLLRFDPTAPLDVERAEIILGMLERVEANARRASYREILDLLRQEWSAALQQAEVEPISTEVLESLERWADDFVSLFQKAYGVASVAYSDSSWALALDWAAKLADPEPDIGTIPTGADLRDVLNAAWLCRVRNTSAGRADPDPILENAKALRDRVLNPAAGPPARTRDTLPSGKTTL